MSSGLILTIASLMGAAGGSTSAAMGAERGAVVVELFTSEGCSSCPPADQLLAELAAEPPFAGVEIVPLGFHVDYWDHLGWRDRFSSPQATERQRRYARVRGESTVYTPQMVVNGTLGFIGSDRDEALEAISTAAREKLPTLALRITEATSTSQLTVQIGVEAPAKEHADLVLFLTEDGLSSVVKRGENSGRILSHAAVVRRILIAVTLAGDQRREVSFDLDPDWSREQLAVVALFQDRSSRRVLAAARLPLSTAPDPRP
jgi:hypothetical protein